MSTTQTLFKPRAKTTAVRNCTQIDHDVKELVIQRVTQKLLSAHHSTSTSSSIVDDSGGDCDDRKKIKIDDDNSTDYKDKMTSKGFPWSHWNSGGLLVILYPSPHVEINFFESPLDLQSILP